MFFVHKKRKQKTRPSKSRILEALEQRHLLAADLIAHWRAQDLATDVADGAILTGWGDSVGEATAEAFGSPTFEAQALGGRAAIRFDAADGEDYFRIATSLNPIRGTGDYSVAVVFATASNSFAGAQDEWFKNTAIVDSSSLGFANDWGISINQAGKISAGMGAGFGNPSTTVYSADAANDNGIHLAILSRSGDQLSLQIDDGLASSASTTTSPVSSLDVSFGAQKFGDLAFTGLISEVRFYQGALDATETAALFTEISSFYDNNPPIAVNDEYTLEEDPIIFLQPAATGLLANDTDAESDPLTAVLVEQPQNGRVTLNADGSFFYDPDRDFFGVDTFTYAAVDFRESLPATVTMNVLQVYDPVSPAADTYKAIPSQVLSIDAAAGVLANDANPDRAALQVQLVSDVENGAISLNGDGSFTYDPQGFSGETSFQYQVDDGTRVTAATSVTLIVNTPPEAVSDTISLNEDEVISDLASRFLTNDIDVDGNSLAYEIIDQPTNGQILNDGGTLSYSPNSDFFGSDSFTYQLSDSVDFSNVATVDLQIAAVNDAPIGVLDAYVLLPNEAIERDVDKGILENDIDIDSSQLTASLVQPPAHGELTLRADGSFQFVPDADFLGADSFQYVASDGEAESEVTTVDLIVTTTPVVISEFMATNATTLATKIRFSPTAEFFEEELHPDWIEIQNQFDSPLDISGMHLTDDPDLPTKWRFPDGTSISARGYLIVYASGYDLNDPIHDENGRLHTNFNLNSNGEYLALGLDDGTPISVFDGYPVQRPDMSYGEFESTAQFFTTASPLGVNLAGIAEAVADTTFSVDRGYYTEPFAVEITTATAGATIVYTLDGSVPSLENGTQVPAANDLESPVAAIQIAETSTLRAAAFKDGMLPTNVDTQSYFFVADIVQDSRLWDDVVEHPEWGAQLADSLQSLPAISLVSDDRISQRESETSVEMIFPDGSEAGFQIDAGIEHYGGHTLNNSPKKNMRLSFKSAYGEGSLKYDLFGEGAVSEFEQILLRTGSHDTWFWTHPGGGKGNYVRNRYAFDRQLEKGNPAPHGRWVQVYINGRYWGLHQLMERPNSDFMASYLGGYSFEYDALNAGVPIDGNADAWRMIRSREVMEDYDQLRQYLDVENYADYMLFQFFGGNDWDWNHSQNWMGARKREPGAGYIFFHWDSDVIFRSTATANVINRGGPGDLWRTRGGVRQHPEFIMMLADRAQNYFFDGGMFTDERFRADINALVDRIRLPMIAESALWGRSNRYSPDAWLESIDWMLDRYAPEGPDSRALTVIEQMRRADVFPSIDAPRFVVNAEILKGGDITSNEAISITATDGVVYYGLDGVDPRLPGGDINPQAALYVDPLLLQQTETIKARSWKDGEWSALMEGRFRVDTVPADATNLRIAEVHYHPTDVSATELDAGFSNADDFEFIELVNISDLTIDLSQVRLRKVDVDGDEQGVDFDFSNGSIPELAPGERLLVVEDTDAFAVRYGEGHPVAGQWSGRLSNASETISLVASDAVIHEFIYSDEWYPSTDGSGPSLQIVDQTADPSTWGQKEAWRASSQSGGTPGTADLNVNVLGDSNHDGVFDSGDLVAVFQAGEYEDAIDGNSTFEEGDWNGDGDFTTTDLVFAFQEGNYVNAAHRSLFENLLDERRLSKNEKPNADVDSVFLNWLEI